MNTRIIAVALFLGLGITTTFAQINNERRIVPISSTDYQALKASGALDPTAHYQVNILPEVTSNRTPKPKPSSGGSERSGGCACYIEPDASYTLAMAPNDDGSTANIPIPFDFCLYGTNYNSLWINNNGNITFDAAYGTFSSVAFPSATYVMVAPFWADVDTRGAGQVWYKITPTAVYVNWVAVGYFSYQTDKLNTFSLIITNGNDPVIGVGNNVAFCYQDMQWTTGSASSGVGGFGGIPATVGCNKGDGVAFVQYGRFDQPGTAYDGPLGANDGVSWLDNQSFIFNACNTTNISPTIASGIATCDTIELCLGDTVIDTIDVLSPEIGQFTTLSATSLSPDFNVISITNGNVAQIIYSVAATAVGTFDVQLTASDDGSPPITVTYNITFRVNPNTTPIPTIVGDTIICPGENTVLIATGGPYDSYQWGGVSDADSSATVNAGGTYSVWVSLNGCRQKDTINVYAFPQPIPVISGATAICNGSSTDLTVTNGPFSSYSWSTSDTDSTTTVSTAGTYTVTVTDVNSCSGSSTISVSFQNPYINITAPNTELCDDATMTLTAAGGGGAFDTIYWNTGATVASINITTPGTYWIYGVTTVGCPAGDTVTIALAPDPTGNIVTPPIACQQQSADFSFNNTGLPIGDYTWDFGVASATNDTSDLANPGYVYPNSGVSQTYTVTLFLTGTNGCLDTVSTLVEIHPQPLGTINSSPICAGSDMTFNMTLLGDPVTNYNWVFPSGIPGTSTQSNPQVSFPTAGNIPVQVTITSAYNCTTVVNQNYLVRANPDPQFGVYPICISRFTFDPLPIAGDSSWVLDWNMGDGTLYEDVDTSYFNHNYLNPGVYNVTLVATDQYGCVDSVTQQVDVKDTISIHMPNVLVRSSVFENNKIDVETFKPGFNLCIDYTYSVFDRWGVLVFETHNNPQDPDLFCNRCFMGKSKTGSELSPGVYFYIMKGNFSVLDQGYITIFE